MILSNQFIFLSSFLLGAYSMEIKIIDAPYHVQIERDTVRKETYVEKTFLCAAAIVDYRWILTTGTCVENLKKYSGIKIRSGSKSMSQNGGIHIINDPILHPDYKKGTNLGLVQLIFHFALSCTVFPIEVGTSATSDKCSKNIVPSYTTWNGNTTASALLNMEMTTIDSCSLKDTGKFSIVKPPDACGEEGDPVIYDGVLKGILQKPDCKNDKTMIVQGIDDNSSKWIADTIVLHKGSGDEPPRNICPLRTY